MPGPNEITMTVNPDVVSRRKLFGTRSKHDVIRINLWYDFHEQTILTRTMVFTSVLPPFPPYHMREAIEFIDA